MAWGRWKEMGRCLATTRRRRGVARPLEREGGQVPLQTPGELVGERLGEETGTLAAVAGQTVLFLSLGEI